MSLKYSFFLSICLYLFLLLYQLNFFLVFIFISIFVILKTKDFKALFFIFSLFYFVVNPTKQTLLTFHEGQVIEIKENYIIVKNKQEKVLLYTHAGVIYDETISYKGEYQKIESDKGFYTFNFKQYMNSNGVYYSCYPVELHRVNISHSLRSKVLKRINTFDEETSAYLKKIIFNIHHEEFNTLEIFTNSGLSLTALLYFIRFILEKIIREKTLNYLLLALNFFLCIFYHFPFVLVQYFIFQVLRYFHLNHRISIGLGYLIVMYLYPASVTKISFLIPMLYRVSGNEKEKRLLYLSLIQSIFFHEICILKLFFFKAMFLYSGFLSFASWLNLLIRNVPINSFLLIYKRLNELLNLFTVKGNPVGIVFVLFFLCSMNLLKTKKGIYTIIAVFYLFLYSGLFHPFGEVTFLNVGQGSSLLIRAPFNTQNILIDTGKEKKYRNLQTYLDSKSITSIDHLIITHYDEDHSGNIGHLVKDYDIKQIHDSKEDICDRNINLYQLNTKDDGDTNDNSLVFVTRLNGLNYLFMGDATKISEKQILIEFPNLETDILLAGHHGSKTSSSKEFIETIKPVLTIFSSGNYSIYHHPSVEVVQLFEKYKIETLNTYDVGDITILFLPVGNLLITSTYEIFFLI